MENKKVLKRQKQILLKRIDLNNYAVSQRGESSRNKYRVGN